MKVDFRFTVDGDLALGSPQVNEEGELLYVDAYGNLSTNSTEGELIRDIPLRHSYLSEVQVVLNRLRTDDPDWQLHPNIGANLSDLIGKPNTRETGDEGCRLIVDCLTKEGFIKESELDVRAIPYSRSEIIFRIVLTRKAGEIVLPILYNLEHGILTEYEVKTK